MFFINETEVCNFADDTTIYWCPSNYNKANKKLSSHLHVVSNWFRINTECNSTLVNPRKFLCSSLDNSNITFFVENKRIKSPNEVKLLEINIDDKLKFTKHMSNSCNMASNRLRVLTGTRKFLSQEQARHLSEAYIMEIFK